MLALPGLERDVGRHPEDFYRTPGWAVDLILPHLREPLTWLDAGCGDGAIAERLLAKWPRSMGMGVELDPARARAATRHQIPVFTDSFLRRGAIWEGPVELVISNPPYTFALEFAERALQLAGRCEVAFLLRAGFLEAKRGSERDEFLEEHKPDVYLLGRRPRFTGDGGGDSATYAWLVWGPGRGERFVRLRAPEAA